MSVSLSGGARGWLEHSFIAISPTCLSKGDGVRVRSGSGRSPTCSSTISKSYAISKSYVGDPAVDVASGRACECWAGVAPTDPRTGRASTGAAVQLRSSGVEANDRRGSRYGESRRRRTTGRGQRRRSSGYGGNDISRRVEWMHACLAGEGEGVAAAVGGGGGGGSRWSLLAMASSRRVLGAGKKEEGREEGEREEGQPQFLLRSSRKATWHSRKPHPVDSFRKVGVHVAGRSLSGRPVGLANVLQGAHTERSSLLSSLSSQGNRLRSSQISSGPFLGHYLLTWKWEDTRRRSGE
ncbi:hypothetical protein CBR_g17569 [Chara braunii]|uniref:Uncharacterized protein n=1 Tax=Chara braunii TaxID=69332 RepID=A0A388KV36_CHABU|nr:hypothetical protein CBR_g17569 [Chara braunii]|eukprot:GBG73858.1 hypothetical protein CBR_g17569 [Chara braunii]